MIYVMSDIHGHEGRFDSILKQIDLQPEDTLYVLGDVIDRNPRGGQLLRRIMKQSNIKMLLGNHEHMMLDALTKTHPENEYIWRWYRNGGEITHDRYKRCTRAYRAEMLEIIRSLPVNVEVKCNGVDYLLVHGAPLGFHHKYGDPVMDSVWKRLDHASKMPEGKTVIFGHTPTDHYQTDKPMRIYHGNRMIGIDSGCAYKDGRLACLRLDDMKEFYSEQDWTPPEPEKIEELIRENSR